LRGWRGGIGNFPNKNSCTEKKNAEKQNRARGAMGTKIKQALSAIIILILNVKTNSCTSYCQGKQEKNHSQENYPTSPSHQNNNNNNICAISLLSLFR